LAAKTKGQSGQSRREGEGRRRMERQREGMEKKGKM